MSNPKIYKSHSFIATAQNQESYVNKISLEEIIDLYRNEAKSEDHIIDFEFIKNFIKNEIKINFKKEFFQKKILSEQECIELFNLDYESLNSLWEKEFQQKKRNNLFIHYNPNSFDEKNILTIKENENDNDDTNVSDRKTNVRIKSDGTIETCVTITSDGII